MAIYFGLLFVIWLYGVFGNVNASKKKKRHYLFFSFGLMILVMCLRKYTVGRDLNGHYAESFLDISSLKSFDKVVEYGNLKGYGAGYSIFNKLVSMINPNIQFFIIVTSFISLAAIGLMIYLYSNNVGLSTFLVIANCTYYIYFSMIRQAMAVSFVIIGYILFNSIKKKPISYIALIGCILLASTFHSSAILCLMMLLFLNLKFRRKEILLIIIIAAALFILYDNFYSFLIKNVVTDAHYYIYSGTSADSFGVISFESFLYFLLASLPFVFGYYFIVWKRKKRNNLKDKRVYNIEKFESFLLFVAAACMICRLLVFRMNIFGRFAHYFVPYTYLLYPYILDSVKIKNNYLFFKWSIYIVFMLYFLWMTLANAQLYYGVIPYEFYWE